MLSAALFIGYFGSKPECVFHLCFSHSIAQAGSSVLEAFLLRMGGQLLTSKSENQRRNPDFLQNPPLLLYFFAICFSPLLSLRSSIAFMPNVWRKDGEMVKIRGKLFDTKKFLRFWRIFLLFPARSGPFREAT